MPFRQRPGWLWVWVGLQGWAVAEGFGEGLAGLDGVGGGEVQSAVA